MMCRVFAQPVGDSPTGAASPSQRGSRPLSADDHLLHVQLYYQSLPQSLREEVRRNVQAFYEERARTIVAGRRPGAMEAPAACAPRAGSCWDEVIVQPDERAPHGAFFRRVRRSHDDRPVLVPRAPGAVRALSLTPRRPT
jgi:hypothetical protein